MDNDRLELFFRGQRSYLAQKEDFTSGRTVVKKVEVMRPIPITGNVRVKIPLATSRAVIWEEIHPRALYTSHELVDLIAKNIDTLPLMDVGEIAALGTIVADPEHNRMIGALMVIDAF